ncbi:hypothetical protein DM02DRAFT_531666 [Periconia macrospinosa]|uniref:Zn(2)-C6 fungal-type domain-containing protein n=1 Tax=Periconia macrospinosa TaxID=97972 RepID=A0A2V1DLN5_9PLEO|nr:hypothetical protein DM02DRAFT_531666 [Periconia macrospinosa]
MSDSEIARKSHKRRRITRACDRCSSRSVKCRFHSANPSRCKNCIDYGEACTFDRPMGKRGARPKAVKERNESLGTVVSSASPGNVHREADDRHQTGNESETVRALSSNEFWKPKELPGQAIVMDLTEIYFEVVYPVFPFFHRPTLLRKVSRGEYTSHRPLFAAVMAICALSSARVRDGALYTGTWDANSLQSPSSEDLFKAAAEAIPSDAPLTQEFDYMRAYALLAITSIQLGDLRKLNYYLCLYHSCTAVGSLHDENNWPADGGFVEIEERRRLFWSTYTLDVFSSIIWGGVVKSRESCYNVRYPIECNDEAFNDAIAPRIPEAEDNPAWLRGWNFVTDLYRILEHTVDSLGHLRRSIEKPPSSSLFLGQSYLTESTVIDNVMTLYNQLPPVFRATQPITGYLNTDLFGFQAANIAATLQLVRMAVFTTENSTVTQKCQIASEVINGFASVPVAYLRAISAPLLHHLAGIGTILGSAFENGLSESSYQTVRSVLLDLANLLATLEVDMYCAAGTSDKLRTQVSRIDEFMSVHRSKEADKVAWTQGQSEQLAASPTVNTDGGFTIDENSPQIQFPAELFEDWSWAIGQI